jgi:hypothetical protein
MAGFTVLRLLREYTDLDTMRYRFPNQARQRRGEVVGFLKMALGLHGRAEDEYAARVKTGFIGQTSR